MRVRLASPWSNQVGDGVQSQSGEEEEEGPACLPAVQVLGHPEVLEVAVVSPDVYLLLYPFKEVPPLF